MMQVLLTLLEQQIRIAVDLRHLRHRLLLQEVQEIIQIRVSIMVTNEERAVVVLLPDQEATIIADQPNLLAEVALVPEVLREIVPGEVAVLKEVPLQEEVIAVGNQVAEAAPEAVLPALPAEAEAEAVVAVPDQDQDQVVLKEDQDSNSAIF